MNSNYLELALIIVLFACIGSFKGYLRLKDKEYQREQAALLKWQIELEDKASKLQSKK
nr:MAG TPA: hypothetical protein [Bacteriophage sp.]